MKNTTPIAPPNPYSCPRPKSACRRRLLAAGLTLGLAFLVQSARSVPSYGAAVLADNPVAFWQLNETGDPSTGSLPANDSSGNGYNGTWGTDCLNYYSEVESPQPPEYAGFDLFQGALQTLAGNVNSVITLPYLNLNTNTVTICMWINPAAGQANYTGLLGNRTPAGDAAVVGFSGNSVNGMAALGYTWNTNSSSTYNWNSQLYAQVGIWQFVAWVIQSNSATIYLYYTNNGTIYLDSAVNSIPHAPEAFTDGLTLIGDDVNGNAGDSTRVFNGVISDVAVYNSALTAEQILALFGAGVGVGGFTPVITGQPVSQYVFAGNPATLKATGINGTSPLAYQWTLNGTNVQLIDPTNFTGANSSVLTIGSVTAKDAGLYQLTITNLYGSVVSSNALLAIQTPSLVGEWLNGTAAATNLADVSGYSLATKHGAYIVGAGNLVFTNDAPPGKTGYSAFFYNGDTGLAISNSSTWDANYDNTFDNQINNAFTVSCWARGFPAGWYPFVSKWGEGVPYNTPNGGWQLRADGDGQHACFTVRDLDSGGLVFGNTGDALDDMATTLYPSNDGGWHFYAGTFNAVAGVRNLYVDGMLAAQETNNVAYQLAPFSHLVIGGKDSAPGNSFGFFSTFEIYDVRIYNFALTNGVPPPPPPPPYISVQPQSVTVFTNTTAQFRANAIGTAPLAYRWQLNGTNVNLLSDSANFTGANSNVLTILNVTANDAGLYRLIVTNNYGSAVSSNAVLTIEYPSLVGEWLAGGTNFADVSGYSPPGTHDGYAVGGQNYQFSSDVPPYRSGYSLNFSSGSGVAISNSATCDPDYVNTYDGAVSTYITVSLWAKGVYPAYNGWPSFLCKNGESGGWQLRYAQWGTPCFTVREHNAGAMPVGNNGGWDGNDDLSAPNGLDGNWHFWTGTYNSVTGNRYLYIDGVAVANETGNVPYIQAPDSHVTINCEDSGNGSYGNYTGLAFKFYDMRIYNYELTGPEVWNLYATLPPGTPAQIGTQPPANITTYCAGITVQIHATSGGSLPLTNQWTFNGTNLSNGTLPDGAVISGADTPDLTIANVTTNEDGLFALVAANAYGSATSSNATLTVGTLIPAPAPAGNLVGAWLTGTADLADHSGYSPAGTHDGYGVNSANHSSSNYTFTNDVPPVAAPGDVSLYLYSGSTAIAISNSSIADAGYTNTFDENLTNAMTVEFWAKGVPTGWSGWLSKHGDVTGWQLRVNNSLIPDWTMQDTGGTDISSTLGNIDNNWHFYAGTFDSVSGVRSLYVDGNLAVQAGGSGAMIMATGYPLCIGAEYANNWPNYNNYTPGAIFTGKIFGVKIYNIALSADQINFPIRHGPIPEPPTFSGNPVLNGNQFVLTWTGGSLLSATNVAGPWTPVAGATSPYTNLINMTAPNMFFKLSNP